MEHLVSGNIFGVDGDTRDGRIALVQQTRQSLLPAWAPSIGGDPGTGYARFSG
jgi:hypothetical protein